MHPHSARPAFYCLPGRGGRGGEGEEGRILSKIRIKTTRCITSTLHPYACFSRNSMHSGISRQFFNWVQIIKSNCTGGYIKLVVM